MKTLGGAQMAVRKILIIGGLLVAGSGYAADKAKEKKAAPAPAAPVAGEAPAAPPASSEHKFFASTIYDLKDKTTVLHKWKHEPTVEAEKVTIKNTFLSADGKDEVYTEVAELGKDGGLKSLKIQQKQIGAEGGLELKDGKIFFSYTVDGKTKTDDEKLTDNFVVAPTLVSYIGKRWDQILEGKKIETRYGVIDRRETVGFQFFKEKDVDFKGQKAVVVKMKPTSFVIAAIVDPLHFTFSADGKTLLQLEGRTPLKKGKPGSWKDLDALTVYEY